MIRILGKIPNDVVVACSGGPDSMAIVDFLLKGRKNVTIAYFDHGTAHGSDAGRFIFDFCRERNIPLITGAMLAPKPSNKSQEEHWRDERYKWLNSILGCVITGHHLDDAVEWYLFTSLHGNARLIPYRRSSVIRPFLTTPKSEFINWCNRNNVKYLTDPGNHDEKFMRSIIRHTIVPQCLRVNPGLRKVIKKKIIVDYSQKWENKNDS
jgi:tRNA(Ile)-lysidine synthase